MKIKISKLYLKNKSKKAFTLTELLIVMTILIIISSIGYRYYQGYLGTTRDSLRVTDIHTIYKGYSLPL